MPEPTAREQLLNHTLAATPNEVTWQKAEQLADAYEAQHRDQVLTEAAELLLAHPDYRGVMKVAAGLLLDSRTTQPAKQRPVVLCELPHPVVADTWCALRIEHPGWHEDAAGTRWPNLLLAARTSQET